MNIASKLSGAVLAASLFCVSAIAPVVAQPVDANQADRAVVVDDDRDDGFDWGLLGLLGLLGLMPKKRQEVVVQRDDPNRTNNMNDSTRR